MTYFVKIENATETRKRLLETTKDLLSILTAYHRAIDLRDQKLELLDRLKQTLADLGELCAEADRLLPERSFKEIEQYLPKESPKPPVQKSAPKRAPLKPGDQMDRLQSALANIEERLNNL